MTSPLGIIAGTGFYSLSPLKNPEIKVIETKYGKAQVTSGSWHDRQTYFLTRHGTKHSVPPHKINYRANIQALADLGVEDVLAVNVCGGLDEKVPVGGLQVVDDFIDFTKKSNYQILSSQEKNKLNTQINYLMKDRFIFLHTDDTHNFSKSLDTDIFDNKVEVVGPLTLLEFIKPVHSIIWLPELFLLELYYLQLQTIFSLSISICCRFVF